MEREDLMNKARANKCMVDAIGGRDTRHSRQMEMAGFLDLMHPEMSDEKKAKLVRETE